MEKAKALREAGAALVKTRRAAVHGDGKPAKKRAKVTEGGEKEGPLDRQWAFMVLEKLDIVIHDGQDQLEQWVTKTDATVADADLCALRERLEHCLLYTSPSPRDKRQSRMPSSA